MTPIIRSLLETDLCKCTMWQTMLHRHPQVRSGYRFMGRTASGGWPSAPWRTNTCSPARRSTCGCATSGKLRIDPHTKRLVFSDGLDLQTALRLHRHFADRTQLGFGIGTHLTNDVGLRPHNTVMKLVRCNDQPVAKLADSPGKTMCTDATFLAYLRQVFGVTG